MALTISAINLCSIGFHDDCSLDGDWLSRSPNVLQAVITQRNATTVYANSNNTILAVYDLSTPVPANFTANQFLQVFDLAFNITENATSNSDFTSLLQLGSVSFPSNDSIIGIKLVTHLAQALAVPLLVFNENFVNGAGGGLPPEQSANFSAALATRSSRVRLLSFGS